MNEGSVIFSFDEGRHNALWSLSMHFSNGFYSNVDLDVSILLELSRYNFLNVVSLSMSQCLLALPCLLKRMA